METDWSLRFIKLAQYLSTWSKDPSTKVGCVIVGADREILSTGFNGFPRGIGDDDRLNDRAKKYPIICHAEENAILHAARNGIPLKGSFLYVSSLPPCARCARMIIQTGISVVAHVEQEVPERWREEVETSANLFAEAGVLVQPLRVF